MEGVKMTELKCPFCGKPLQPTHRIEDEYFCENYDCSQTSLTWIGTSSLWKAFADTKKKLDIAVDRLKGIKAYYDDSYADPHTFVNWHIVAQRLANDANDALEQIKDKDVK